MNRVIKFRVWTGKKMFMQDEQYLASFIRRAVSEICLDTIGKLSTGHESYLPNGGDIEEYLMQYTGLQDRNGKDIYEFLEKLTQANLSLRLLRVLCHEHVKHTIDAAIKEVDEAVRAPITRTFYKDPSAWLISSIECLEEAARRDARIILRE